MKTYLLSFIILSTYIIFIVATHIFERFTPCNTSPRALRFPYEHWPIGNANVRHSRNEIKAIVSRQSERLHSYECYKPASQLTTAACPTESACTLPFDFHFQT
uniref:Putative secreted protein synganglion overexpressed n=1 Tax=Rhipicephalus microplus TaxID=6941 RepID=A0A6M2DCC7_RHIMP